MASKERKLLGEILCEEGYLNTNQLAAALEKQRNHYQDRPLGHILLDMGYITSDQLCDAVLIQTKD